ncbi:ABC transporter permease [Vibrio hangzhouensis]|uniref:Nucleoside ABC transporter membrane protein n=1 Tax=Vibrio hangzhouensis TaxID=462991 RepID=A0A1H5Y6K9_9VIBR|nr:ABC transporter permease [Vibrio hangzhouensis]SEG19156.1 nucleoside ABC transporter membrane protein [Vibrio hangzhouensis]
MLNAEPRVESSKAMAWISPFIAIVLTMLTSSLIFMLLDVSPVKAFNVFIIQPFSDAYNIGELLVKSTPLLLCAVGLAICYRANIWNIGAEGQLLVGAIATTYVAINATETSGFGLLFLALLAGIAAGMAWAAIPTFLNRAFHTNIILTTIMLNYIGLYTLLWAVHGPLADPQGFGFPESVMFSDSVLLPLILDEGRASISILIAIVVALLCGFSLFKTLPGFKIRVYGEDQLAARYAGFSGNKIIWGVMLFAGALAGFAGAAEVTGPIGQLIPSVSPGYGYAAIIVAYLGRLNPYGIIVSALFMGALYMGSDLAQIELGLPTAITGLFQGCLLFFLLACDFLIFYRIKVMSPKAYFSKRAASRQSVNTMTTTATNTQSESQNQGVL